MKDETTEISDFGVAVTLFRHPDLLGELDSLGFELSMITDDISLDTIVRMRSAWNSCKHDILEAFRNEGDLATLLDVRSDICVKLLIHPEAQTSTNRYWYIKRYIEKRHRENLASKLAHITKLLHVDADYDSYMFTLNVARATVTEYIDKLKRGDRAEENMQAAALKDFANTVLKVENPDQRDETDTGIKTGLAPIDDAIVGISPGKIYAYSSRPGLGKTAIAMTVATNLALAGKRVLVVSTELPAVDVRARIFATLSKVAYSSIGHKKMSANQLAAFKEIEPLIPSLDITIIERISDWDQIMSLISVNHRYRPFDLVVLDQLNSLTTKRKFPSDHERFSSIVTEMNSLCISLAVPIWLNCQLNRGGASGEPTSANVAGSDTIVRIATGMFLAWAKSPEHPNLITLRVEKNRDGGQGSFSVETIVRQEFGSMRYRGDSGPYVAPEKPKSVRLASIDSAFTPSSRTDRG